VSTFTVTFVSVFATWVAVAVEVSVGGPGPLVPSIGLVVAVLAGRRSPPGRVRWVALAAGLVAGSVVEGGLFVVPATYLLLASAAGIARRSLALETPVRLAVAGLVFALLEACALAVFQVPGRLTKLADGAWPWAMAGLVLTGVVFVFGEFVIARAPRVRHAFRRP
jgi:hypothetical protein